MNEPTEEKPGRGGAIVWVVITMLLLYILSVGPAARMVRSDPHFYRTFHLVYAPLTWFGEHVPFLIKPIRSYVDLW